MSLNGNISQLTRSGTAAASLSYNYTDNSGVISNKLQSVTNNNTSYRSYVYDANGNATSDGGLGGNARTIGYNLFNLPMTVSQGGNIIATYLYDADGNKLNNQTSTAGNWDYDGSIVYKNNALAFIQTEEGRVDFNSGTLNYIYNLKDHLGNVRVSFDKYAGVARVIQEDEYYAFGLRKSEYVLSDAKRYLYNGKELQTDLTNQYDYGARFYDPMIGRWTTVDPLAEKSRRFSPYNYVSNNPIRNIDPDGMEGQNVDPWSETITDPGEIANVLGQLSSGNRHIMIDSGNGVSGADKNNDEKDKTEPDADSDLEEAQARGTEEGLRDAKALLKQVNGQIGPGPKLTHAQEYAKYGQISTAFTISTTVAAIGGFTHEIGILNTDKGWYQYYETVYFTAGLGLSWGGNVEFIHGLGENHPTFSDWRGLAQGVTGARGALGVSAGLTSTYWVWSFGFGLGGSLVKGEQRNGFISVGSTRLLGEPYRADQIGQANFSNFYIKSQTYNGGN